MAGNKLASWAEKIGYNPNPRQKAMLLVYGEFKVGKTLLASTFPGAFFIDADKGMRTIKGDVPPSYVVGDDEEKGLYKDIMAMLRAIRAGDPPFDKIKVQTLVVDGITALAQRLMNECMRYTPGKPARDPVNNKPEWDDYMMMKSRIASIITFAQDMGLNVVATCREKIERDEVTGTFVGKPNVLGSYRDDVGYEFDDVGYMTIEGKGEARKYMIYFSQYKYFGAGSRSGLPLKMESPTYEKLYGEKK